MSERESRDAARSASVVHYMERDLDAVAAIAAGLIDRVGARAEPVSLLAILPHADDALALSESVIARRSHDARHVVTPLTSLVRSRRIIASGAAAVASSPGILGRLVAESRIDLSRVSTVLLVWPEESIRDEEQRALFEGIVAELPRAADRVAFCAERSPELAQFLERAMWRAREIDHATAPSARSSAPIRAVSVAPAERLRAIRTVLDTIDPESVALIAFSDAAQQAAHDVATLLGPAIEVVRDIPDRRFALGILVDEVPAPDVLSKVAESVDELIVVVRPSRLPALHKVASNVTPLSWTGAFANARLTYDALRDEIRGYVGSGGHVPWIALVEPLLEGLDPVEVAAASLALLDRERRKAKRTAVASPPAPAPERPARDTRPGATGRPGRDDDRGRRDDRVRRDDRGRADDRGRKDDRGRPPQRGFGKRPFRDDARHSDAARGPRGGRDFADRASRDPRRRDEIERVPRAAREGREWSERGERLRNARRGPRSRDAE